MNRVRMVRADAIEAKSELRLDELRLDELRPGERGARLGRADFAFCRGPDSGQGRCYVQTSRRPR